MEIQEWEIIPEDGFLEIHHDDDDKKIFSRKYVKNILEEDDDDGEKNMLKNNYFIVPSTPSSQFVETTSTSQSNKQLFPLQIHLQPTIDEAFDHHDDDDEEVVKEIIMPTVSFKNLMKKESEKFEMKSNNKGVNLMMHQVDKMGKNNPNKDEALESEIDQEKKMVMEKNSKKIEDDDQDENSGNFLSLWKWSLTGIGAICSFGVAAATICIIFFGTKNKNKHHHHQHSQKLQFHIYTDDKRIKKVVHQASRLNEAISAAAATGVPITRAHFTIGGYCDGLY